MDCLVSKNSVSPPSLPDDQILDPENDDRSCEKLTQSSGKVA